jgi:hypothetical protein
VIIIFGLLFLGLALFFWAGTLFFQAYIYSQPAGHLYWRGPVAALVVTGFFGLWAMIDYKSVGDANRGKYRTVFEMSSSEDVDYPKFWSVRKGGETLYVKHKTARGTEFREAGPDGKVRLDGKVWKRSDTEGVVEAVVVEEKDGAKSRFNADLTPDGKFNVKQGQAVRYVEADGRHRVMTDDYIGTIHTFERSLFFKNIALNLLHLGVWFLCLWLLLQFQWSHAFGLAIIFWLVFTLAIPPLLDKAEARAKEKAASPGTTAKRVDFECALFSVRRRVHQVDASMCMMSPSWTM